MPIYEFHCDDCDTDFEYLVMGSRKPEGCPDCKSNNFRRLMSACGFVSKGAGGQTSSASAGTSCGSCAASSCAGCGH